MVMADRLPRATAKTPRYRDIIALIRRQPQETAAARVAT